MESTSKNEYYNLKLIFINKQKGGELFNFCAKHSMELKFP